MKPAFLQKFFLRQNEQGRDSFGKTQELMGRTPKSTTNFPAASDPSMEWTRTECLGIGSVGFVSLGESSSSHAHTGTGPKLPDKFAVKSAFIYAANGDIHSSCESLVHELEVFRRLEDCPNIIKCYGSSTTHEAGMRLYNLFLEYATNGDLFDRIHGGEGLSEKEIREYTRSILLGLSHIHKKGVIHCDIKPENILLVNGIAKITDFGHATCGESISEKLKGTAPYMAPESVICGMYGREVDIWAVGCTVVEMLARKRLTDIDSDIELKAMERIGKKEVELPPRISEEARDFLDKCLKVNPSLRWDAKKLLKHPFVSCSDTRGPKRRLGDHLEDLTSWKKVKFVQVHKPPGQLVI